MTKTIIPLTETRIPTVLSRTQNGVYLIGDEARLGGIKGITNAYSFKHRIGASDTEYIKDNQFFIAPSGNTNLAKTYSVKEVTEKYLEVLLQGIEDYPDSWIVGQPPVNDETWLKLFRKHIREAFSALGHNSVEFWPEPFAVFQYYCSNNESFSKPKGEEFILVIDVGGGTFNSSVIHTTESGDLARGGAKRVPYGLQSEFVGGHIVDEQILDLIINKAKMRGVKFKEEDVLESVRRKSPEVLLKVEDAKIAISKRLELKSDSNSIIENLSFPAGTIHPSTDVDESISADELQEIVRQVWRKKWFPIVNKTLNLAEKNHGAKIEKIDRVLIAGGSAQLPNMKMEAFKCLSTKVEMEHVYLGLSSQAAVSTGIALECLERSKRDPGLTVNHLANCFTDELYFGLRKTRKDDYQKLLVKFNGSNNREGQLLSSPMESKDLRMTFKITSPFDIRDKLIFAFSKEPLLGRDPVTLNPAPSDIISIDGAGRSIKREFDLDLVIKKDGQITPTFTFHTKSRIDPYIKVNAPDVYFEDLSLKDGSTYVGVDFGNSNSYLTKYLAVDNDFSISEYPRFEVSKKVKRRLLSLEQKLQIKKNEGTLSTDYSLESLSEKKLSIIYNSNKIEGNKLSFGETTSVILGDIIDVDERSKTEVVNLDTAYDFVTENYGSIFDSPSAFIREVHRIISKDCLPNPGEYRAVPVRIQGVDYVPPQAPLVRPLMDALCREIQTKGTGRSPIEFVASIHTAFTMIHPFEDGNGRTARAIVAALLVHFGLPQVVLKIDDRSRYMTTLGISNSGDISGVVELILDIVEGEIQTMSKRDEQNLGVKVGTLTKSDVALDFSNFNEIVEHAERPALDFSKFDSLVTTGEAQAKLENDYQLWSASMDQFRVAFSLVCNQINSKYRDNSLSLYLEEFDSVSLETFIATKRGEPLAATWFFQVQVNWLQNVSLRFSFVPTPETIEGADGGICLLISTPESEQGDLAPIAGTLHKYVFTTDRKVKFFPETANRSESLEQNILDFLAEAIDTYQSN